MYKYQFFLLSAKFLNLIAPRICMAAKIHAVTMQLVYVHASCIPKCIIFTACDLTRYMVTVDIPVVYYRYFIY